MIKKLISFDNKPLVSLVLALGLALSQTAAHADTKAYHFGAWTLKIAHDAFSNTNTCKMSGKDMSVQDGIVSLNFKPEVDTENAWYRINGGDLAQVKAFQKKVDSLSVFREPGPLENPSAGKTRFPVEALIDASYVDIKPNEKAKVKHFKVDGLSSAIAFMTERECVSPST